VTLTNTFRGLSRGDTEPGILSRIGPTLLGAWSPARRLRDGYTGPLLRVRRSTDSAETDIGVNADGTLDTATLLAHCQAAYVPATGGLTINGGVAGNYSYIPDAANLDITGDLELVARAGLQWSSGNICALVAKWRADLAQRSYMLSLTSGLLYLRLSADGTNQSIYSSTASLPFADYQTGWVKVTRRQSDGRIQFFTAPDQPTEPTSWTQLGADVTGTTVALLSGTSELHVGAYNSTAGMVNGTMYRAIVRNGIGGTTVADIDLTRAPTNNIATSFAAETGQTVTIGRSGQSAYVVREYDQSAGTRGLVLPGTASNGASVPNSAALQITGDVELVARFVNLGTAGPSLIRKGYASRFGVLASTSVGMEMRTGGVTSYPFVAGLTAVLPYGTTGWIRLRRVASTGAITVHWAADQTSEPSSRTLLGTTTSTAGALEVDGQAMCIGAGLPTGASENMAGAVYRAIVRDGIAGTTVLDIDFTNVAQTATSFTATTGQTVTINATAANGAFVGRPAVLAQGTTASQPRLVNAGVIDVYGGRPCPIYRPAGTGSFYLDAAVSITGTTLSVAVAAALNSSAAGYGRAVSLGTIGVSDTTGNGPMAMMRNSSGLGLSYYPTDYNLETIALAAYDAPFVASVVADGATVKPRANGVLFASTPAPRTAAFTTSLLRLGRYPVGAGGEWAGGIGDVLVTDAALSDVDRLAIERDLGRFYGVTVA
jgi:hypothetical protein